MSGVVGKERGRSEVDKGTCTYIWREQVVDLEHEFDPECGIGCS